MDLDAEVGEHLEKLGDWIDLLRSDHSRFWYHSVEGYEHSLPAVLITDTGNYKLTQFIQLHLYIFRASDFLLYLFTFFYSALQRRDAGMLPPRM